LSRTLNNRLNFELPLRPASSSFGPQFGKAHLKTLAPYIVIWGSMRPPRASFVCSWCAPRTKAWRPKAELAFISTPDVHVVYMVRGWAKFYYDGVDSLAEAGDCVHQRPGIVHGLYDWSLWRSSCRTIFPRPKSPRRLMRIVERIPSITGIK